MFLGESVFYLKRKEKSPLSLWFHAHGDNIISLSYCLIISQRLKLVLVINYNNHVI
jgi:hypothetical protein